MADQLRLTIKISGHLLTTDKNTLNLEYIEKILKVIRKLTQEGHRLTIVTGGGSTARSYINTLRQLKTNEAICDLIGIEAARLNASLLAKALGKVANAKIPETVQGAVESAYQNQKILLMGGLQPGQSTTAVAAAIAEATNADKLIIATNVDAIYTADPREHPEAEKLREADIDTLIELFSQQETEAGQYKLLDITTLTVLKRSGIPTQLINGDPPENILKAVKGEKIGTTITYNKKEERHRDYPEH